MSVSLETLLYRLLNMLQSCQTAEGATRQKCFNRVFVSSKLLAHIGRTLIHNYHRDGADRMHFIDLPAEMLVAILQQLPLEDLLTCRSVRLYFQISQTYL